VQTNLGCFQGLSGPAHPHQIHMHSVHQHSWLGAAQPAGTAPMLAAAAPHAQGRPERTPLPAAPRARLLFSAMLPCFPPLHDCAGMNAGTQPTQWHVPQPPPFDHPPCMLCLVLQSYQDRHSTASVLAPSTLAKRHKEQAKRGRTPHPLGALHRTRRPFSL
jgi:hypothetical protein